MFRVFLRGRVSRAVAAGVVVGCSVVAIHVGPAKADSYVPVSGAGSTWSANALNTWISDVKQYGMRINYAPTGSTDGRHQFLGGTVDFAASDIPFQSHPEDGSAPEIPPQGSYAYIPVTSGGTTFMYNLTADGHRITNLRLSGQNIAKIFTGKIVNWSDPAIKADNPQIALPNIAIVPVVRSDGSGSTAQFSLWMIKQYPSIWNDFCSRSGRAPSCGETSFYPTVSGMIAQNGDLGVAGYVSQGFANGAIGYVQYSYALNARFPVAKMLNDGGYYTEPTPYNVAVSLLKAQVDTTDTDPSLYLTQQLDAVYSDADTRTYPLSSYSYMILPTTVQGSFSTAKGKTLAAFSYYAMCQGQQESSSLGYSPMPVNLVQDSFNQIRKIPGAVVENINIQSCNNPTFSPSGENLLAVQAPMPPACDKQGATQCATGTGGATGSTPLIGGGSGSATGARSTVTYARGPTGSRGSPTAGRGTSSTGGATGRGTASSGGPASGGSTGPSNGATNGSVPGAGSGANGSSVQCNPDTGVCTSTSGSGGQPSEASASSITLPEGSSSTVVLMVIGALLVLGIILAPGFVSRFIRLEKK